MVSICVLMNISVRVYSTTTELKLWHGIKNGIGANDTVHSGELLQTQCIVGQSLCLWVNQRLVQMPPAVSHKWGMLYEDDQRVIDHVVFQMQAFSVCVCVFPTESRSLRIPLSGFPSNIKTFRLGSRLREAGRTNTHTHTHTHTLNGFVCEPTTSINM